MNVVKMDADGSNPYKIGLCSCGNAHNPWYLSAVQPGLKNEIPGSFYVVKVNPSTVYLQADHSGQPIEISRLKDKTDFQNISNSPLSGYGTRSLPPVPPSAELKPTLLHAAMTTTSKIRSISPGQHLQQGSLQPNMSAPLKSESVRIPGHLPTSNLPYRAVSFLTSSSDKPFMNNNITTNSSLDNVRPLIAPRPGYLSNTPGNQVSSSSMSISNVSLGFSSTQPQTRSKRPAPKPPNPTPSTNNSGNFNMHFTGGSVKPSMLRQMSQMSNVPPAPPPPNAKPVKVPVAVNLNSDSTLSSSALPVDLLSSIHTFDKNNLKKQTSSTQRKNGAMKSSLMREIDKRRPKVAESEDEEDANNDNDWE